ncbi:glycosyltransferase family 2 protein [uncultured Psychrobacter sp.]|uniref:glycosyltransferase family 2 protein n=1 Tax=uncultured Psychrobacter sp. TaxID=259303 RepID=UPI002639E49F|nr:glycosyltransferase family 2 protein [uncultured Psychrobacter sp.]
MRDNNPLVSVIIPSYNHEKYIQESIQSVINQDYMNIELIVIDDGSKDNSVNVIHNMIDLCEERFVRFEFVHRHNKGLCATLNEALEWCRGEFFSPLASDDIALPHKISYLTGKILDSDFAVVFGLVKEFGDSNKVCRHMPNINTTYLHSFESLMLTINIPAAPAAMLRKSSVIKVGGYAEDVNLEDRYMWLTLTSNNEKIITFPNVVTLYRDHSDNTTKNFKEMHISRLKVLNKFRSSKIHKDSIKKVNLTFAQDISRTNRIASIKVIILSKNFNVVGLKVIAHALLPSYVLKLRQDLREKKVL